MYIVIVGGGKVGYYLAKRLYKNKHTIALIEKDKSVCEEVTKDLDILVINGDGCDSRTLESAGCTRADVLAALTGVDQDNIIVCQMAKELFHISRTVARVNDSQNEQIFNELGIDVPIDSTGIIARIIEEEVSLSDFVNLLTFRKGKLALVRIDLPKESPVINKHIKEINLPTDSVLVALVRGTQVLIPNGDTLLQTQDEVIAITTIENEEELLNSLIGSLKE